MCGGRSWSRVGGPSRALALGPAVAAVAAEPSRVQRGLFIGAFVLVIAGLLLWLRRRGDAARWRQRRARIFAQVRDVEQDCDGVVAAPDPAAVAAAWSRLEPRVVVCLAELDDLARSGSDPAQASDVRRVREALAHLSDQLRDEVTRRRSATREPGPSTPPDHKAVPETGAGGTPGDDGAPGSGADAARRHLREVLTRSG